MKHTCFYIYFIALTIGYFTTFHSPEAAAAKDTITLQLIDDNFIVEGKLLKFDGKTYTIDSKELGQVKLEAKRFICIDGNCPRQNTNPYLFHNNFSDFSIHGSNTIGTRLMPWIIRGYAREKGLNSQETISNNGLEVTFTLTKETGEKVTGIKLVRKGSSTAFPALRQKQALIGMSDRPIKDIEVEMLKKIGATNVRSKHQHVIGIDGIVIVVSHENPISALSVDQVADIFSGKVRDWADVGGNPGKINIFAPGNKSGTFSTFKSLVLKPRALKIAGTTKRIDDNQKLSTVVAQDPRAIGITGFAFIDKSKAINFKTKCGLIHKATPFNVQTGSYPLSRRLFLYTATTIENRHAVGLLNFVKKSTKMNSILNIAGFINNRISSIPFNEQKERVFSSIAGKKDNFDAALLRKILSEIGKGRRISFTAKFEEDTNRLTTATKEDLPKLIRYLKKNASAKDYIVVAGFSDSDGDFRNNALQSLKQAKIVRRTLIKSLSGTMDPSHIIARGYGELLPTVCGDSEASKRKNRRVEVWIINSTVGSKLKGQKIAPASSSSSTTELSVL